MAFRQPKTCPICAGILHVYSHENGPSDIADSRNWYYKCEDCGFRREKWLEDIFPSGKPVSD